MCVINVECIYCLKCHYTERLKTYYYCKNGNCSPENNNLCINVRTNEEYVTRVDGCSKCINIDSPASEYISIDVE